MSIVAEMAPQFVEEVKAASSILIGTHLNPDGDALGSALAVSLYLDSLQIENEILCHHAPPKNLQFLPGVDRVRQTPRLAKHDLAIVVDLDAIDRLGSTSPYFEACPRMILVDHHLPIVKPGDVRIVDEKSPATSLILTELFLEIEAIITPDIATCLLTGIVTDTGSFRFRNTTPEALSLSATLLENGGDINRVSEEIFQSKTLSSQRLLGGLLERMELTCHNRIAWSTVSLKDFERANSTDEDTEGFANELLSIESVQIAALFREYKPGKIRLSLRSRRGYDIAAVARVFGGGGHENAAGATFEEPIQTVVEKVISEAKKCLGSC